LNGAKSLIAASCEAGDETAVLIARLGHLLLNESLKLRGCACGCGELFIADGKRIYFEPACGNRLRHRKSWISRQGKTT
jgi:hypothetical protein